jgi:hypothetical protein
VGYEVTEFATFPGDYPGGLRVEMDDGRVFQAHLDYNVGSSRNPLSPARLDAKLIEAAGRVGEDAAGLTLLAALKSLRRQDSDLRSFAHAIARFGVITHVAGTT